MKQFNNGKSRKGFTLIELLIVIAVLGILVIGILVVLNPVEQTRRANDASRTSTVSQLATAVTAFYTSQLKTNYADFAVVGWQTVLVGGGEIKNVIIASKPTPECGNGSTTRKEGNVCSCTSVDDTSTSVCDDNAVGASDTHKNIVIWTNLESKAEATRAGCSGGTPQAIVAYDSSQQKSGVGCVATSGIPLIGIPLK